MQLDFGKPRRAQNAEVSSACTQASQRAAEGEGGIGRAMPFCLLRNEEGPKPQEGEELTGTQRPAAGGVPRCRPTGRLRP